MDTNIAGKFVFENLTLPDTAIYFIQAKTKAGMSMNVGVTIESIALPATVEMPNHRMAWYVTLRCTPAQICKYCPSASRSKAQPCR